MVNTHVLRSPALDDSTKPVDYIHVSLLDSHHHHHSHLPPMGITGMTYPKFVPRCLIIVQGEQ